MEHGLAGAVIGFLLFLFPGAAWTWALLPLGWARTLPVILLLAFTLVPGLLFLLNLLFDLPLRLDSMAYLSVAVGMVGIAWRSAPSLRAQLAA